MKIPFESPEKIEARATANAIFGLGIYLGGAMASLGAFIDEQDDPSATGFDEISHGKHGAWNMGQSMEQWMGKLTINGNFQ